MSNHTYEASPHLTGPAYVYITSADGLPSPQHAGDDLDALARVKLFDPDSAGTWYVAGYDPETRIAWGPVSGVEQEYGSIDMAELVAVRGALGLSVDRDLFWRPCPLTECLR